MLASVCFLQLSTNWTLLGGGWKKPPFTAPAIKEVELSNPPSPLLDVLPDWIPPVGSQSCHGPQANPFSPASRAAKSCLRASSALASFSRASWLSRGVQHDVSECVSIIRTANRKVTVLHAASHHASASSSSAFSFASLSACFCSLTTSQQSASLLHKTIEEQQSNWSFSVAL